MSAALLLAAPPAGATSCATDPRATHRLRSVVGARPWIAVAIGGVRVLLAPAMLTGRHVDVRVGTGWL